MLLKERMAAASRLFPRNRRPGTTDGGIKEDAMGDERFDRLSPMQDSWEEEEPVPDTERAPEPPVPDFLCFRSLAHASPSDGVK